MGEIYPSESLSSFDGMGWPHWWEPYASTSDVAGVAFFEADAERELLLLEFIAAFLIFLLRSRLWQSTQHGTGTGFWESFEQYMAAVSVSTFDGSGSVQQKGNQQAATTEWEKEQK
jgi:hypothetical protein